MVSQPLSIHIDTVSIDRDTCASIGSDNLAIVSHSDGDTIAGLYKTLISPHLLGHLVSKPSRIHSNLSACIGSCNLNASTSSDKRGITLHLIGDTAIQPSSIDVDTVRIDSNTSASVCRNLTTRLSRSQSDTVTLHKQSIIVLDLVGDISVNPVGICCNSHTVLSRSNRDTIASSHEVCVCLHLIGNLLGQPLIVHGDTSTADNDASTLNGGYPATICSCLDPDTIASRNKLSRANLVGNLLLEPLIADSKAILGRHHTGTVQLEASTI